MPTPEQKKEIIQAAKRGFDVGAAEDSSPLTEERYLRAVEKVGRENPKHKAAAEAAARGLNDGVEHKRSRRRG